MKLEEIRTTPKSPNESFKYDDEKLDFKLVDFWKWNQSDLIENRNRGILAEFIVRQALNIKSPTRLEWNEYDLETSDGLKIEVKSAAYIQAWKQKYYSRISFDIKPTKSLQDDGNYSDKRARKADIYVFCLLHHKDQKTINPIDLSQWTFYVVSTNTLDKKLPDQHSIGLWSIERIDHEKCEFSGIKESVNKLKES